jgi:hypothetical protein
MLPKQSALTPHALDQSCSLPKESPSALTMGRALSHGAVGSAELMHALSFAHPKSTIVTTTITITAQHAQMKAVEVINPCDVLACYRYHSSRLSSF